MRTRITALVVAVGLVAGALALAWSGSTDATPAVTSDRSTTALRANLVHAAGGSFYRPYTKLAEMLPNALATHSGQPGVSSAGTDSVVVGEFASAVEDAGFIESDHPGTAGVAGATRTAFGDPKADWRTLRVTVTVDEVLAGERVQQLVLDWALRGNTANGEAADTVVRELKSLGRVVLLSKALPIGPEFLGMKRTLPDPPAGLALVATDGALSFPFFEPSTAAPTFMSGLDTLAELRAETRKPTWTRSVG